MASRQELIRAVDLALSGDWDGAHKIAQTDEQNDVHCWLHACLHKIEGDAWNARYWYKRTRHVFEEYPVSYTELAAIRGQLTATGPR